MKIGAVIVAAGMSSRMRAFKPLLTLGSSTIIGTAIATLRSAEVDPILVVTGNQAEKLEQYLTAVGVTGVFNERFATTDMFFFASIGLAHLKDRCDRVFFLPGDVPLFARQSLLSMLAYMDGVGCEILQPIHDGDLGHPILIHHSAIASLIDYKGDGGLRGAIDSFSGFKRTIELDDAGMTLDADRPEDYERLLEYIREQPDDTKSHDERRSL